MSGALTLAVGGGNWKMKLRLKRDSNKHKHVMDLSRGLVTCRLKHFEVGTWGFDLNIDESAFRGSRC